jgi:hypothetical protein
MSAVGAVGDSCRYELSIFLSHELIPLRMFSDSEVPPDVDNQRPYDFQTAESWVGADKRIAQITEPEKECFLFYATSSKQSDVDAVVRLAGQTKNVVGIVLNQKPSPAAVVTLPVFVVKWAEVRTFISHPSGAKISIRAVSAMAQKLMEDRRKDPPRQEMEQHTVGAHKRPHDAHDSTPSSSSGVAASHTDKHLKTSEQYNNSPSLDHPKMSDHSQREPDRRFPASAASAAAAPYQMQQGNVQGSMMGVEIQLDRKKSVVSHPLDESDSSSTESDDDTPLDNHHNTANDGNSRTSTGSRADSNTGYVLGESDQQSGEITSPSSRSFEGQRAESRAAARKRRKQEKKDAASSSDNRRKDNHDDEDEELPTKRKESKNLLARGADFFADVFWGPDGWDKVLGDMDGWSESSQPSRKPSFKRYIESMDRLDKASKEHSREKLMEISIEVHKYLQRGKCNLMHLAFAAKVFLKCSMFELATTVLVRLNNKFNISGSSELANAIQQASKYFQDAARKPGFLFNAFFKQVFKSWANLGPFPVRSEALLICIFECWVMCGMFQCKNINWSELRLVVSREGFSLYDNLVLQRSLGIARTRTVGLLLCENVGEAARLLKETIENTHMRFVKIDSAFAHWLIELMTGAMTRFEGDLDTLGRIWSDICTTLGLVSFLELYREDFRRDVLMSMICQSSFRERKSFQYYLPVMGAVRPEAPFYGVFLDLVRESLILDLRSTEPRPQMHQFLSMLDSRAGEILATWNGERSILDFMKSNIIHQRCFRERLAVIGRFFDILFTKKFIVKHPERVVPSLVSFAMQCSSTSNATIWIEAFQVAKSTPSLFQQVGDEQLQAIVEIILPVTDGAALVERPRVVTDLLRLGEEHVPGPLFISLRVRLEAILLKAALSINKACSFYLGSHIEASTPASMAVAESVFLAAFSAWNPSSITAIVDTDENTLNLLFRCFNNCPPGVAECGIKVTHVVNEWYRAFQDNMVTRTILHDALQDCKKAGWQSVGTLTGIQLPNESAIAEKVDEIDGIALEVIGLLSVQGVESTLTSLSSILKGYNCHPAPTSELDCLLSRYEHFLLPNSQFDTVTLLDKSPRLELRQIHSDRIAAADFSKNHGEAIQVCDYFLKNPSALFRKGMSAYMKNKMEVEALQSALERTLKTIGDLFGPTTTFKNVNDAVKLIASSGSSLENELTFLTGCTALQLTAEDQERFKAVALMSRFSGPLDWFIKFCRQFKFAVAQADPCFKLLEEVSDSLVSEEVLGLDAAECMDFSTRLVGLLCPDTPSSPTRLHSLEEDTLQCVTTLGALSTHSEIWTFAREMNWFGKEGLKRFYAEYNNCTNVLLGNTASYEMSVLDALQPTIRAISLIGSLQDAMDIRTLFESLRASSDVKKCSQGGVSSDLDQVQSNLSQIREWFTNGVDDVAAVYRVFQDVCRTGVYSIRVEKDKKPMLALAYQGNDEKKWLQGPDLVGFVQHVSLIQLDDERIAGEVASYAELHMMLSKAANNFGDMLNLGFDVDVESFKCCAGSGQLDQARELLQLSDGATRNFESQLKVLRETYPVSALFFTDELKKLYDIGAAGGPDSELWPEFLRSISRLLHTSIPWEERSRVSSIVVSTMKQDLSQKDAGWLRRGSKLVENLHSAFGDRAVPYDVSHGRVGRIVLHTLAFEDCLMNAGIFCLLRHIYKV